MCQKAPKALLNVAAILNRSSNWLFLNPLKLWIYKSTGDIFLWVTCRELCFSYVSYYKSYMCMYKHTHMGHMCSTWLSESSPPPDNLCIFKFLLLLVKGWLGVELHFSGSCSCLWLSLNFCDLDWTFQVVISVFAFLLFSILEVSLM